MSNIKFDYKSGSLSNAKAHEWAGFKLMQLGAKVTSVLGNVGFSFIARAVRKLLPSDRFVEVQILPDTIFSYPYGDLYWGVLGNRSRPYSADMESFLLNMRHIDYCFIDCGANYGLFSTLVTSKTYGEKPSVAIEADPRTFEFLNRNCALNENRFEIHNRAIFSKSGEEVQIFGKKHEARSILDEADCETAFGNVLTTTPDDFIRLLKSNKTNKSILKLDVEGVEIEALRGSSQLLASDCLVYYEDHGSDKTHEISRFIMEELKLPIFSPDKNGNCHPITELNQLSAIKTNSRKGYDFVATSSKLWLDEIAKLTP